MIGIGALITALTIAYTKFESFRDGVNIVLNGLIAGFELFANSFIGAINLIITGMNLINPFSDIGQLPTISLGRIGGGGTTITADTRTADRMAREAGAVMPTVVSPVVGGGSTGGGAVGGRGSAGGPLGVQGLGGAEVGALTTFGMAERIAAREAAAPVVINVSGGVSTSAEIGQSVYNALLQYKQVYGPLTAIAT